MTLRDGWLILPPSGDREPLIYKLVNGSPYQVDIDPAGEHAVVAALEPGYYDDDLNQVPEDEAVGE